MKMTRTRKITIGLGIVLGSFSSLAFVDNYFEISKNLEIFTSTYKELNSNYVDDVDAAKLMRTGIEAMVESLDPYTNYISESEVEDYRFMTTGQYGGVGASIFQRDKNIYIRETYEGYAAQKAGLLPGDMLIEIDGKTLFGKSNNEVSKSLKGQAGTELVILIKRKGVEKPFKVALKREDIQINNVSYYGMISDEIGIIQLKGFTQNAAREVKNALTELKKNINLKGVVLDLRGNPGGLLHEAVDISNIFVNKGELAVDTRGKNKDANKKYFTINEPIDATIPLAVLTNSSSASASEIVSGVVQDLDRGVVVGQRTFGKGLVQVTRPLSYNAQLKITTAKYYIPSGRCIQALDYSNRNEDGSVGKVADSLIKEFKTKSGRKVYDGGGVAPDISVDVTTYSIVTQTLITKNIIFDYVNDYVAKNPSAPSLQSFSLTKAEYDDFINYVKSKDFDYKTKSEKMLDDYKDAAVSEKYYDAIKADLESLKTKFLHDKNADLIKFEAEIKEILEEEIASRYYYQKGRIQQSLKNDLEVKKAIEILSNKNMYTDILKGKEFSNKN
jgi:carboxyl-terminal processing protease